MIRQPSISCIVPTLNSAATLDTTLLSLRSQNGVEVNVIVADSGSTDGTLQICDRWNVPTIYVERGNMYRAINAGLRLFDTEWLTYVNSDDWVYPDSFARFITRGEAVKADVVYGNCDFVDVSGRFLFSMAAVRPRQMLPLARTGVFGLCQPAAIFRKSIYGKLEGFDEEYRFSADADFYLRAARAGFKLAFLGGPTVACFRVHEQQFTQTRISEIREEQRAIFGAGASGPAITARVARMRWRLSNVPHYLIRFLRRWLNASR